MKKTTISSCKFLDALDLVLYEDKLLLDALSKQVTLDAAPIAAVVENHVQDDLAANTEESEPSIRSLESILANNIGSIGSLGSLQLTSDSLASQMQLSNSHFHRLLSFGLNQSSSFSSKPPIATNSPDIRAYVGAEQDNPAVLNVISLSDEELECIQRHIPTMKHFSASLITSRCCDNSIDNCTHPYCAAIRRQRQEDILDEG